MLSQRVLKITAHVTGWLLVFSLIIAFVSLSFGGAFLLQLILSPRYLLFYAVYIFIFYANSELLLPALYLKKKYLAYFLVIALLLAGVYFLQPFDRFLLHHRPGSWNVPHQPPSTPRTGFHRPPPRPGGQKIDLVSIILFFMIWSFSTALRIFKQWRTSEERAARAEAEKVNAELSTLKAQINPHFLFNTLNNIYALALTKNENTAASIMQLSHIMRYVTDEVRQYYVPLESEVACIRNYIDLQQLRLNEKTQVEFSATGSLYGKQIAPLVLMTFIENVFKYGISSHEPSVITIRLTSEENRIAFFCRNKVFKPPVKTGRTGIGIENTKKRLGYLYPGKHTLNITTENGLYTVELTLNA